MRWSRESQGNHRSSACVKIQDQDKVCVLHILSWVELSSIATWNEIITRRNIETGYARSNMLSIIFSYLVVLKTTIRRVFGGTYLPGVNALEYPGENPLE